jgi:hypothetical protein
MSKKQDRHTASVVLMNLLSIKILDGNNITSRGVVVSVVIRPFSAQDHISDASERQDVHVQLLPTMALRF